MIDVTETGDTRGRPPSLPAKPAAHQAAVAELRAAYAAIPPGSPIRLAKRTSNLFRFTGGSGTGGAGGRATGSGAKARTAAPGLDVSAFGRVLSIDILKYKTPGVDPSGRPGV